MKLSNAILILFVQASISILVVSLLFTKFYPIIYNYINSKTKRGPNMSENLDYLNTIIMFTIMYIILFNIGFFIGFSNALRKRK